ncbi:Endonuclease III [subsurface metagenome]
MGYYSRARNLHKTANKIIKDFDGKIPSDFNILKNFPGIGDYTAAAIASLAFNIPVASVDGNGYRFIARFFGIYTPIDSYVGKKEFFEAATKILDPNNPGKHNQAMIELGALICLPKNPLCTNCPVNDSCFALKNRSVHELPKKKKKIIPVDRYFYYLVINKRNHVFIRQRNEKDIWELLYDFPLIETPVKISFQDVVKEEHWRKIFKNTAITIKKISKEYRHQLSHQVIHAWFIELIVEDKFILEGSLEIEFQDIERYPLPRLIDKYISTIFKEKQ